MIISMEKKMPFTNTRFEGHIEEDRMAGA